MEMEQPYPRGFGGGQVKVIRESYRAGESWPFFVTLERGEEIRGYFRVNYDALLALADEMDERGRFAETAGSDGKVSGWYLREYADRIREALGVNDD